MIEVKTRADIKQFLELLARSKAIWMVPELQNLAESAGNPTKAYELVLQKTGKRRKALAARWYAIALRDYHPDLVGGCIRWLRRWRRFSIFGPKLPNLQQFLINMLAEDY
jgi:hypothetical protein